MEALFLKLLNMSLSAGWLVLAVVAVRLLFRKAPKWLHCALWALVAVRLLCPFSLESSLSLVPDTQPVGEALLPDSPVIDDALTQVGNGQPVVDSTPTVPGGTPDSLAPTPENSVDPVQILAAAATALWLVGVAAMAVYALASTLRLRRQVGESVPLQPGVRLCDKIPTPFILGVFRPCIYLPTYLQGAQMASVLAHEQAHLKRRDHWWKPLGFLLLTVYWFNPLMWVAYILLCRDIEGACDERVVRQMDVEERKVYSEALLACHVPRRRIAACPLAFGETGVKSRVKSVLHYKKPAFWLIAVALVASIVVGVCFLTDPLTPEVDDAISSSSTTTTTTTEGATATTTAEGAMTTTTTASAIGGAQPVTNTTNKPTATAPSKPTTTITRAKPTNTTTTAHRTYPTSVGEDFEHKYRLIVNGKDITKGNYMAYWQDEAAGYDEMALPLMAIMRALGGTAEWKNKTTAVLKKDDRVYTVDVANGTMYANIADKWCTTINGEYVYMDMFKPLGGPLMYKPKVINGEIAVPQELITAFLQEEGYYCHVFFLKKEVRISKISE